MTPMQARTVLGLAENFSLSELKIQYRKKVLIAHPDRNGGDDSRFILVQQAFDILTKFKENPAYFQHNSYRKPPSPNDVYQERRRAEQAYKEKAHYYVRHKRRKPQPNLSTEDEFMLNLKYFGTALLGIIAFFLCLIIAMSFGVVGVLTLVLVLAVFFSRFNYNK